MKTRGHHLQVKSRFVRNSTDETFVTDILPPHKSGQPGKRSLISLPVALFVFDIGLA